jgi:hypothetical protein
MSDVPTLPRKTFRHAFVLILGYLHKVSEPEICVCQVVVTGPGLLLHIILGLLICYISTRLKSMTDQAVAHRRSYCANSPYARTGLIASGACCTATAILAVVTGTVAFGAAASPMALVALNPFLFPILGTACVLFLCGGIGVCYLLGQVRKITADVDKGAEQSTSPAPEPCPENLSTAVETSAATPSKMPQDEPFPAKEPKQKFSHLPEDALPTFLELRQMLNNIDDVTKLLPTNNVLPNNGGKCFANAHLHRLYNSEFRSIIFVMAKIIPDNFFHCETWAFAIFIFAYLQFRSTHTLPQNIMEALVQYFSQSIRQYSLESLSGSENDFRDGFLAELLFEFHEAKQELFPLIARKIKEGGLAATEIDCLRKAGLLPNSKRMDLCKIGIGILMEAYYDKIGNVVEPEFESTHPELFHVASNSLGGAMKAMLGPSPHEILEYGACYSKRKWTNPPDTLYFQINQIHHDQAVNTEMTDTFTPVIDLSKYNILASYKLGSVVCVAQRGKHNIHCVTYVRKENGWWLFDDLSPTPRQVPESHVQEVLNDTGAHGHYPTLMTYEIA